MTLTSEAANSDSQPRDPQNSSSEPSPSKTGTGTSKSDSSAAIAPESSSPVVLEQVVLSVSGMMCAGCVASVERRLKQQDGVEEACVNLVTETAAIALLPGADGEKLAELLTEAGFPSEVRSAEAELAELEAAIAQEGEGEGAEQTGGLAIWQRRWD
ncbi:MAG: heavy metal-associated domain-containing protein, partial [Cyanobacteria bacterium P01_D01_bin.73]